MQTHEDSLVILDEVQRVPELFQTLRGLKGRRRGKRSGRFLLPGSASADLLRQSETLAGRIAYVELSPLDILEAGGILHLLLNIGDGEALLRHPVAGGSWEGFVMENLIGACPPRRNRPSAGNTRSRLVGY